MDVIALSERELYLAEQTAAYVLERLPGSGRRVLEVGAGTGELALLLGRAGHEVLALDASPDAVATARGRGVDARVAVWPEFDGSGLGAVLFSRSLHHIAPLEEAVRAAARALEPDGVLLIEDFAFHEADAPTIAWFRGVLEDLRAAGRLTDDDDAFAARLLNAADPVELWHHESDHIHRAAAMRNDVERFFTLEAESAVPYLYRYVAPLLRDDATARQALGTVRTMEAEAAADGHITLIGRRWSGQRALR